MCPSPAVCVFQNTGLTGTVLVVSTAVNSTWINLTANGLSLPWGSFNDNSGSSVVFGDAQTGVETCYPAGTRNGNPPSSVRSDRYMWIEFGVTDCTGRTGPLP
jgi:hypothetical protein